MKKKTTVLLSIVLLLSILNQASYAAFGDPTYCDHSGMSWEFAVNKASSDDIGFVSSPYGEYCVPHDPNISINFSSIGKYEIENVGFVSYDGMSTTWLGDITHLNFTVDDNYLFLVKTKRKAPPYLYTYGTNTLYIDKNGILWGWGSRINNRHVHPYDESSPLRLGSGYVSMAYGDKHCLMLKEDGSLWAWGDNTYGQLGDGTYISRDLPVKIGEGFIEIAAGKNHSMGLKNEYLYTWGDNSHGQLGSAQEPASLPYPNRVYSIPSATHIVAGSNSSFMLSEGGDLYAWGENTYGQLGDGTRDDRSTPVFIGYSFMDVSSYGSRSNAVKADGTLWAWGINYLGDGSASTESSNNPVQIGNGFEKVSTGDAHSIAVKSNGTLWAWGYNGYGQVGDNTDMDRLAPVQVGTGYSAVSSGWCSSLALKQDGTVWGWGWNDHGELGVPAGIFYTPRQIAIINTITANMPIGATVDPPGIVDVTNRDDQSFTITAEPGFAVTDVLVDGNSVGAVNSYTFDSVSENHTLEVITTPVVTAMISSGYRHSMYLDPNGNVWTWGQNNYGQLGDNTRTDRNTPAIIGSGFIAIAAGGNHSLGIKADNSLWTWGYGRDGQLGDGQSADSLAPKQIGEDFIAVEGGGRHSLAFKDDGSLWAWGLNDNGQLGDGTTENKGTPTRIGTGFVKISGGGKYTLALKADGTLAAWGDNGFGQLGDGTGTDLDTPTEIGKKYISIAADGAHSLAVNASGELYAWGVNMNGQLGDGTTIQQLAPKAIDTDYDQVEANSSLSFGFKTDGTLWAWGKNTTGQLGDGSTTDRLTPGEVGSGYTQISIGASHTLGLKADGSVMAWGDNAYGQLGDGTTSASLLPKQVTFTSSRPEISCNPGIQILLQD